MRLLSTPVRIQRAPLARTFAAVALVGVLTAFAPTSAMAQVAANHSMAWTGVETIYIDPVNGQDKTRDPSVQGHDSTWGRIGRPYMTVQHGVSDVLAHSPKFPVVFNISGTHQVVHLELPAFGVKLQPALGATATLDGGGTPSSPTDIDPVLLVNSEGPRVLPDGSATPATIIQGLTITGGGFGVKLDVETEVLTEPLRTEIRDCTITANRYGNHVDANEDRYWGGAGIYIRSHKYAPTRYVIEHNEISEHGGEYFPTHGGPWSYGIWIETKNEHSPAFDSTLIRGNRLLRQETGIAMYGPHTQNAWIRPRILSNFLSEHEQHIWSVRDCGPVLINNTVLRMRDYCAGPDRHVVHHQANPTPAGANPWLERTAMIVRNCIFDHWTLPNPPASYSEVSDPIRPLPDTTVVANLHGWPTHTFGGGGTIDIAWNDYDHDKLISVVPGLAADLRAGPGNELNRTIPFVDRTASPPDLHLEVIAGTPAAPMIEGGDLASTTPGVMLNLDGQFLPCDVRVDVDGDARACDFDSNGSLLPDRGADEVLDVRVGAVLALNSGLRLTSNADANGNVLNGATVTFTVEGRPNEAVMLLGWIDCPTNSNDDVVFNHLFMPPVGNVMLPPCGLINSAALVLNAQGITSFSMPLSAVREFQAYFQAVGLSAPGLPATGHASNRVRIELN
jgi:hypothetical protein